MKTEPQANQPQNECELLDGGAVDGDDAALEEEALEVPRQAE